MNELHVYGKLAKYYDVIYSFKDYKSEAEDIARLVSKYKRNKEISLLDVGCGTGMHIKYLKSRYKCVGTDLSENMLRLARKNVKDIKFVQSDMSNLNIKESFDVITCLFSAIGYLKTAERLKKTFSGFYKHLNAGGVCIIDAWFDSSHWKEGSVHMRCHDDKDLKIARVSYSGRRGNMSILDEYYLIAEKNKDVVYIPDKSELRLTERDEFIKLLSAVGFRAILLKGAIMGRDRYIGIKD